MAIKQGDGSIILTTDIDQSGLKKGFSSMGKSAKSFGVSVAKSFAVIGAAAGAATIAIAKASVDAYAEYEQLVGGVETLFKGSSEKLLEYANEAYRTTGQSANEYMKNVTAFSASLLSAVGGDTEKAADIANAAMISISDNVNKMGSSVESVQMAFQGFAKQQYMLLDNLKLGYGGTKTEMERLLRDAEAYRASMGETVDYEISNLADVYTAIGDIQEKLGIAGTTAKEAATTISGSAATMKAAWQNVLTAIAGGGDLDRAINNLVDSISIYFENIVPVVERSLVGIGRLIEKVAPMLVQTVARSLIMAIPSLLNAVYEMIIGLAKGIYQGVVDLFNGTSREVLTEQAQNIQQSTENQKDLTKAVKETNKELEKTTASFDTVQILSSSASQGADTEATLPEISGGGFNINSSISKESEKEVGTFTDVLQKQFEKISKIAQKVWTSKPIQAFTDTSKKILKTFGGFVKTIWGDISRNSRDTWGDISDDVKSSVGNLMQLWTSFWSDVGIAVDTWRQPITAKISGLFNSIWQTAFNPFIQMITNAWNGFTGLLLSAWEENGATLLNNVGEFVDNFIGLFQSIYDNIIEPIITPFLEELTWLWDEHISGLISTVYDFISSLVNGVLEIYNKFIDPIVKFLLKILSPAWSALSKTVIGVLGSIVGYVADIAGGIIKIFKGLIDFIVGVFTGNLEKAFGGIKTTFQGLFDAIAGAFKGVLNIFISIINGLTTGINGAIGIINDIPGVNIPQIPQIPQIPKLATGTVVPPNKQFMAILGDNTKEHEIVSPISTMKQAFMEAMVEMGESSQSTKEEHYYLNETELMRIVYRLFKGGERLTGDSLK